jgi:hypothetical protein
MRKPHISQKIGACMIMLLVLCSSRAQKVDYQSLKEEIEKRQTEFQHQYDHPALDQDSVVKVAQQYLHRMLIDGIFPAWYGTAWDYNGTTTRPGVGKIACGYFVTTTLQHLGFDLPRVKWAQMPSETMIRKMIEAKYINRYRNKEIGFIKTQIEESGTGVYVVGMDSHVGFIVNIDGNPKFVHSDYFSPTQGVVSEKLDSDNPLAYSEYRVIGKILTKEMTIRWLSEIAYEN